MSATNWTNVLNSVHSVFIDELTEIREDPKPELGLPMQAQGFAIPETYPDFGELSFSACMVEAEKIGVGFVFFAGTPGFLKAFKLTEAKLWESLIARSKKDFKARRLAAELKPPFQPLKNPSAVRLNSLIWYPFQVPEGQGFIGLGI